MLKFKNTVYLSFKMEVVTHIDESDFVEAVEGRNSLEFGDEKQQARFELGVSMMVYKWVALDIAVANQWGGPESEEKRDWITGVIVDLFKNEKVVDVQLIEETLVYAMFDEFETNVEDDSALHIAAGIISVYRECANEDYSTVERLFLNWNENKDKKQPRKIVVTGDSSDEEDEGEEGSDEDMDMCDHDHDHAHKHEPEEASEIPEPVVDEDGFELVQKKGKKRY